MNALTAADRFRERKRIREIRRKAASKAWETRRRNFTPEQISAQIRAGMTSDPKTRRALLKIAYGDEATRKGRTP